MGFDNRSEGKYFTIINTKKGAKFAQRVQEGTEGAEARVNKMGVTVFEKYHDSFTAKLIDVKVFEGQKYGKQWEFSFRDNGEVFKLQLGYTNSLAQSFLKILPNINLDKEVKLSPSTKEVDGKPKNSLFVNQDGVALKHAYTRDNPNGLPEWKEIIVKGVKTGDNTDQMLFLENMVKTQIIPKLSGAQGTATAPVETKDSLDQAVDELNAGAVNTEDEPF